MPRRAPVPCKKCKAATRNHGGYCDSCAQSASAARRHTRRGKTTDPFYGTAAWKRFRDWYKQQHPLCEDCLEEGRTVPVYCVDHVVEIKDGGAKLDPANARSLCRKCHAMKTAKEKRARING